MSAHELMLRGALGAHGAAVGRGAEPVATSSIHHEEHALARTDKLTKLIAVFDLFFDAIARFDDPTANALVGNWTHVRHQYVNPIDAPRSALAAGLEQGLREMPMLLKSIPPEARKRAIEALSAAIVTRYPDFLAKDAERLARITARGAIRSENEYHLVRHHVDLLELRPHQEEELRLLYELIDRFEALGG